MEKKKRQTTYKKLVESATGIWKKGDGLAYQEKLRAEWEHRLKDCSIIKVKR